MLRVFLFPLLSGVFAVTPAALADSFKADIKQADELSKAGQSVAALDAMDRATTAIWLRSPLAVRKAFFVTKPVKSFGEYEKRANNIFPKGSNLHTYAEAISYNWEKTNDLYKINMVVDVALKNTSGKILWSKKEFGTFRQSKASQFKKLYFNLRLGIQTVPVGKYLVEYTLIDKLRQQVVLVSQPFEIR